MWGIHLFQSISQTSSHGTGAEALAAGMEQSNERSDEDRAREGARTCQKAGINLVVLHRVRNCSCIGGKSGWEEERRRKERRKRGIRGGGGKEKEKERRKDRRRRGGKKRRINGIRRGGRSRMVALGRTSCACTL